VRILFVASRFPSPPLRGDQARAYHQIRLLGQRHRITLACFASDGAASPALPGCAETIALPLRKAACALRLVAGVFGKSPLQTELYRDATLTQALGRAIADGCFDVAHVQLARMAPHLQAATRVPRLLDLVDAISLNMQRRAERDLAPLGFVARIEAARLRRYEQELVQRFERTTVVSEQDRQALGAPERVRLNPNGVDLAAFPFRPQPVEPPTIVFTGNLGYFPNVDAVRFFAEEVLPLVHRARPDAIFEAVGARPAPGLARLARRDPHMRLTGPVSEMAPHLHSATVAVAPLRTGSGQLLKVLEAMACGTPVVASSVALSGIDAEPGRHVLVADTPEAVAGETLRLIGDAPLRQRLAREARALIEARYTWDRVVADLERLYEEIV
jgi:sugar transferase (PEP-CTERM/EpsH1 system associated)